MYSLLRDAYKVSKYSEMVTALNGFKNICLYKLLEKSFHEVVRLKVSS